ncbi:hypothetical protein EMCRGX_G028699 [Ephydatia muelleri]
MRFLLSPFPPNITMKYDDPKVKFWRSLIISSCKQLKRLSFTEDQLVERFCWNTFRPRCLGPILDAMERQGDIQKQTNAIGADEGWVRWGVNILSKPVTWLWGSATTRTCVVEYVLQEAVKEVAEAIMAEHQRGVVYQNTDHVMLIAEYCQLCEKFVVPENTDVVARHMMKEGKIVQSTLQGGVQVIKFVPSGHGKVTEADLQIVHLKQAVLKMSAVVKNLCDEINRLRADALSKYRERDQSAVGILKRAKNKTAKLQKHELVLDNLNAILERIQAAETDKMILNAYTEGLDGLKKMKLDEEAVAVVMDELQEVMQDSEHINQSIAQDITGEEDGEEALLKELEALLSGNQEQAVSVSHDNTLEEKLASLKITKKGTLTIPLKEKGEQTTPLKVTTPLRVREQMTTPMGGVGKTTSLMGDERKHKLAPRSPVLT